MFDTVTGELRKIITVHYDVSSLAIRRSVNQLQVTMHCCGVENYTDWLSPSLQNSRHSDLVHSQDFPELTKELSKESGAGEKAYRGVPFSCCDPHSLLPCLFFVVSTPEQLDNHDKTQDVAISTINQQGCRTPLIKYVLNVSRYGIGLSNIVIVFLEVTLSLSSISYALSL